MLMAMRRLAILLLFLPSLAFAASPATLETRSPSHALTIDVVPIGDSVEYVARVTDLGSGELLATAKFEPGTSNAQSVSQLRDLTIRIRLYPTPAGVSAMVEIQKGDVQIDSMDSRWTLQPRRVRIDGPKAVLRVGGDVKAPVIINKVEPIYPEEARKARITGIVILEALIDKSGDVRDATVLKPLPFGLDQAALDAMRQWKFKPATLNGQPVDVVFNVTVNFKLDTPKVQPPPAQ
jgi:TonB family protein